MGRRVGGSAMNKKSEEPELSKKDTQKRLDELAKMSRIDYDRSRKTAAKELGIRETVLDVEVAELQEVKALDAEFGGCAVDPWKYPVEITELVQEIYELFERYVVITKSQRIAVTLWIVHAHTYDAWSHSPISAI